MNRTKLLNFELTEEERSMWGDCPVCNVGHGEQCAQEVDGMRTNGFHYERLSRAPLRVRIVQSSGKSEEFAQELSELCNKYKVILVPGQAEVEGFLLIEERDRNKPVSYDTRRASGFGGFFYLLEAS